MVIDFHTHSWPEKIAARAVESLVKGSGGIYPPVSDGTLAGLLNNMNTWKIDYSVLQPVVTKESQVESTNLWVAEIQNQYKNQIVSFGGIWPHSENYKSQIDFNSKAFSSVNKVELNRHFQFFPTVLGSLILPSLSIANKS